VRETRLTHRIYDRPEERGNSPTLPFLSFLSFLSFLPFLPFLPFLHFLPVTPRLQCEQPRVVPAELHQ
jgi:hypothetical protein